MIFFILTLTENVSLLDASFLIAILFFIFIRGPLGFSRCLDHALVVFAFVCFYLLQRGNPILKFVRSVPWEFGEVVPDYVLGRTTCALFLR